MTKKEQIILKALKRRVEKFDRVETVGQLSHDLAQKKPETLDPIAQQREMQKDYMDNLTSCIERHRDQMPGDFYVEIITKTEKIMSNVIRNYFSARTSCPSPRYDQTVFKYNRAEESVRYIWTVPSQVAALFMKDNIQYAQPEERELAIMACKFYDGSLLALARKLNKEEEPRIIT